MIYKSGMPAFKNQPNLPKGYIFGLILFFIGCGLIIFFKFGSGYKEIGADYKGDVIINAVQVVNPRFISLTASQVERFLIILKDDIKRHMGVDVVFKVHPSMNIQEFFGDAQHRLGDQEERFKALIKTNRLLSSQSPGDLTNALFKEYLSYNHKDSLSELIKFSIEASPSNQKLFEDSSDLGTLMSKFGSLHFKNFKEIERIRHNDGRFLLNKSDNFNEYLYWAKNILAFPEYDFILTNQLIASIEITNPSIHTSLRGGVTLGFAGSSYSQYGSTVIVSTFPLRYDHKIFRDMRGNNYNENNFSKYLSKLSVHEFGHSLSYWEHYYGLSGCVMRPVPALHFEDWVSNIGERRNCKEVYSPTIKHLFLSKKD